MPAELTHFRPCHSIKEKTSLLGTHSNSQPPRLPLHCSPSSLVNEKFATSINGNGYPSGLRISNSHPHGYEPHWGNSSPPTSRLPWFISRPLLQPLLQGPSIALATARARIAVAAPILATTLATACGCRCEGAVGGFFGAAGLW